MPDWSRRQALTALASGVTAAIAGCKGHSDGSGGSPGFGERRIENYALERVRNADGAVLVGRAGEDLETERPGASRHLTSDDDLAALTFADVPEARALRRFSGDTDFESESVYLYTREVPECYEHRLLWVEVDANGPSAHFCRDLRPVEAACGAEAHDTVGYAIRLPFPGDEYRGMGSGMSSSCSRPRRPETFDANVTLSTEREDR